MGWPLQKGGEEGGWGGAWHARALTSVTSHVNRIKRRAEGCDINGCIACAPRYYVRSSRTVTERVRIVKLTQHQVKTLCFPKSKWHLKLSRRWGGGWGDIGSSTAAREVTVLISPFQRAPNSENVTARLTSQLLDFRCHGGVLRWLCAISSPAVKSVTSDGVRVCYCWIIRRWWCSLPRREDPAGAANETQAAARRDQSECREEGGGRVGREASASREMATRRRVTLRFNEV